MSVVLDKPEAAAKPPRKRSVNNRPSVPSAVILALFAVYFLLPLWWLLVAATKNRGDLVNTFSLWFAHFQLGHNLSQLFSESGGVFVHWVLNSIIYACGGALAATLLSAMAGYVLGVFVFPGRQAVFSVVLASVLIPTTALTLPLFLLMSKIGLTDNYLSVLIPSAVSPFGVYLARIFAQASVPAELLEAGRLDGAGELRLFFGMSIRLMSPGLVTIFLFQFVAIWNNYFLPLIMLTNQSLYPVPLGLGAWSSYSNHDPTFQTPLITGAFVSCVPLLIAFLLLQRLWRAGLAAGGLKS
jgi:multiple sugar transport system permease protein